MDIRQIQDQHAWDAFVASRERSQFLQSWAWGEFQHKNGRQIFRYGFFNGSELNGVALVIEMPLPFGQTYWFVPRGPVIENANERNAMRECVQGICAEAKNANTLFVRVEPPISASAGSPLEKLGAIQSRAIQPADTQYLSLQPTEEELLQAMHEKTRYNIRLAERKGVHIRTAGVEGVPDFWKLNEETTARDGFRSHGQEYYQNMFEALPADTLMLYLAEYEGQVIAANIVSTFGDTTTYMHGASSNTARNVMAPHLLQWRQIQDAKKRGSAWYDFWGIAPSQLVHRSHTDGTGVGDASARQHPWAGITRFKQGFGGELVSFVGTFDIPVKPFAYGLYTLARSLR